MKDVKPLSFYGIYNNNLPKKTPPLLKELNNCYWNAKLKYYAPKTVIVDHVFRTTHFINIYLLAVNVLNLVFLRLLFIRASITWNILRMKINL